MTRSVPMRRGIVFAAFILVGSLAAYCDAIPAEGEVLLGTFTILGFVTILWMEDRKALRFPVLMRAVFVCSNAMAGEGVVDNVSMDGCKIKSITTVQSGAEFQLRLYPPAEAPHIEIQKAVVHWTKEGEFGLQFTDVEQQGLARLRHLIKDLA